MLRRHFRRGSPASNDDRVETYLIVGLGNPGRRYQGTRHNVGFMVVDRICNALPGGTAKSRFQADYYETRDGDKRVVLAKPQTFMNESGIAVGQLVRWYKIPNDRVLVIYDDLELPFGALRLRASGSAGGHNGMSSVISHLRSEQFPRLRVGIDRPRSGSTVPYVLSAFSASEQRELPRVLDSAADAARSWLRDGITAAMNTHNQRSAGGKETKAGKDTLPDAAGVQDPGDL
jgi:peptidyl-tRNA hydrolase, PTH1 family